MLNGFEPRAIGSPWEGAWEPQQQQHSDVKQKVNLDICRALRYGNSFTCKQAIPAFTPQPQSMTDMWLVLVLPFHGG